MIPEYKERIAIRLAPDQKEKIQRLVEGGDYKSISEVIRDALTRFLMEKGSE